MTERLTDKTRGLLVQLATHCERQSRRGSHGLLDRIQREKSARQHSMIELLDESDARILIHDIPRLARHDPRIQEARSELRPHLRRVLVLDRSQDVSSSSTAFRRHLSRPDHLRLLVQRHLERMLHRDSSRSHPPYTRHQIMLDQLGLVKH